MVNTGFSAALKCPTWTVCGLGINVYSAANACGNASADKSAVQIGSALILAIASSLPALLRDAAHPLNDPTCMRAFAERGIAPLCRRCSGRIRQPLLGRRPLAVHSKHLPSDQETWNALTTSYLPKRSSPCPTPLVSAFYSPNTAMSCGARVGNAANVPSVW
jgi:hypothetical protein